ncbi:MULTISPECIES: hypothetical protein [Aeromonas]|uniref:hypothetical protein n=1 Tax=Aeromonas TaxID=642 RepID=UPI0022E3B3A9|nr:hypothetical protein [Aeromonas sp. QDB63]
MSNFRYKVVLSDKLYSIYKRASLSGTLSTKEKKAYEALIGNVELDILTNLAQIERCRETHGLPEEIYNDLRPALLNAGDLCHLTLEELSKKTLFKFIITQSSDNVAPPYFNLKEHHVKRNYNISKLHGEDRNPLQKYLSTILQDAKKVFIHDKYFSKTEDNKKLFDLLPDEHLNIIYVENAERLNGPFIESRCNLNGKWTVTKCDTTQAEFNRFARSHDRYLIINDNVEITLTSGFSYIWSDEKEISCIIKEYMT